MRGLSSKHGQKPSRFFKISRNIIPTLVQIAIPYKQKSKEWGKGNKTRFQEITLVQVNVSFKRRARMEAPFVDFKEECFLCQISFQNFK